MEWQFHEAKLLKLVDTMMELSRFGANVFTNLVVKRRIVGVWERNLKFHGERTALFNEDAMN